MVVRQPLEEFTEEQRRILINLAQQYDAWISTARVLRQRRDERCLKHRRGLTKENIATDWDLSISELLSRLASMRAVLSETARIYVALKLPRIDAQAAKILLAADIERVLGSTVLVGGSAAMLAYHIEANGWIKGIPRSADNIELLIAGPTANRVHKMLRAADKTYDANPERPRQLVNDKGYAANVVTAPELFLGRPVSHVVIAKGGRPARIVAPDPRYFGLLLPRLRSTNEVNGEHGQELANLLLAAIKLAMPHYRLDGEFVASLPKMGGG